uniref:Uncharacterized protein n=1 Tax=Lactuca sativa TaxID=4236 RepID=A0A9R1XP53_LACSA|nr:hypothetical protein LSAT_V11C200054000 [Lactuca sativa]
MIIVTDTSKFFTRTEAENISTKIMTHHVKRMESNIRELHHILPNKMVWLKERTEPILRWSTEHKLIRVYLLDMLTIARLTGYWILNWVLLWNPEMWNSLRTSFIRMKKTPVIQHQQVLLEKYSYHLLLWRNQREVLGLE